MSTKRTGWGIPVVLMLLSALLSIVNSVLLVCLPLALLLVALPPRRPLLMGFGALVLMVALIRPGGDMFWWLGRGWALILGAWFIGVVTLKANDRFFGRGLFAVLGAIATCVLLVVPNPAQWRLVDSTVEHYLQATADTTLAQFGPMLQTPDSGQLRRAMEAVVQVQWMLYPALLALASLGGLAVAWWLWRRLAAREPRPLRPLREFQFRDELIWLVAVAVLLIVLPLDQNLTRLGANLAIFGGALFVVRGLGVLLVLYGVPGPLWWVLGVLAFPIMLTMIATVALIFGLADTWLDFRAREGAPDSTR